MPPDVRRVAGVLSLCVVLGVSVCSVVRGELTRYRVSALPHYRDSWRTRNRAGLGYGP